MNYAVLMTCALLFVTTHKTSGLNSKLDFGEDSETSLVKSHQRSIPIKYDSDEAKKKSNSLDSIGVVCISSGCNGTSSKENSTTTDSVKTNVIVEVKTSVDITNKNKTKVKEDIPDVPVVLGTNGVGSQNTFPGIQRGLQYHPTSRNYGDRGIPIVVTNIEDAFPSLTSTLVPSSLYKEPDRSNIYRVPHRDIYRHSNGAGIYRDSNRDDIYRGPNRDDTYRDLNADGFNREPNRGSPDINFKLLPPEVRPVADGYQYRGDGIEVKVPYFQPAYQNHHYGESSPPQVAYYFKKGMVHNPVAFNSMPRPSYSFSGWSRNMPSSNQNHRHDGECMCPNQNSPSDLHWYPNTRSQVTHNVGQRRFHRRDHDPDSKIDNKLAPLN